MEKQTVYQPEAIAVGVQPVPAPVVTPAFTRADDTDHKVRWIAIRLEKLESWLLVRIAETPDTAQDSEPEVR